MKIIIINFALIIMSTPEIFSQQKTTPCSSPEASQFDFWIGTWNLTYNDSIHATNTIIKKAGGCVIEENFNDPSQSFAGQSWSVFVPATGKWHQTWVDNQGGYIVLTGEFKDNKMTLATEPKTLADGKIKISRMIFYNITKNSFDWSWEGSEDGGKSWKVNWLIHYVRK
jgi:hypothetical protein